MPQNPCDSFPTDKTISYEAAYICLIKTFAWQLLQHLTHDVQICKTLTKLGYKARFQNFKINNMMASTNMGFPIHLQGLAESHADCADVSSFLL